MAQAATASSEPIHPQTQIGHIHLTVTDLERSLAFYRDLLGFEETMRYKDSAVFLSAGGYHHHLAAEYLGRTGGEPAPARTYRAIPLCHSLPQPSRTGSGGESVAAGRLSVAGYLRPRRVRVHLPG